MKPLLTLLVLGMAAWSAAAAEPRRTLPITPPTEVIIIEEPFSIPPGYGVPGYRTYTVPPVLRTPGITQGFSITGYQNYYRPRPDSFQLYGVPASTYGRPGVFTRPGGR